MGNVTREHIVWFLHGNVAELSSRYLSGRIDVARPHGGLHGNLLPNVPAESTAILGVHRVAVPITAIAGPEAFEWPLPVAEAYVRGDDLVASYTPASGWPFSPQLYWRADPLRSVEGVLSSISILVSVQTHLLDTCPQIGVASQLPCGEVLTLAIRSSASPRIELVHGDRTISSGSEIRCIVTRPRTWPISYVEIMAPSDFHDVAVRPDANGSSIEWRLFADFLEKGVIRRAQVHAAFLPRENDIEHAVACCDATQRLELPLTT